MVEKDKDFAASTTQELDKIIEIVKYSTQNILKSYNERARLLTKCSEDIKLLIRMNHDAKKARSAAEQLFGTTNDITFLAIDGTKSQDEALDMVIFYAGAFGYVGKLDFIDHMGCICHEPIALTGIKSVSTSIPVLEEHISSVAGRLTEGGVDVDAERVPSALMHLAEYYMAVKALEENPKIKVVIFDRMLSIDIPHLISGVEELLDTDNKYSSSCILEGMETEYGVVSSLDLELARMLHPNNYLEIPTARSQLIRYSAINQLIKERRNSKEEPDGQEGIVKQKDRHRYSESYEELLKKIGANHSRLEKLKRDLAKFDQKYSLFDKKVKRNEISKNKEILSLVPNIENYWERIFSASMRLAEHIFNTRPNEYPLLYTSIPKSNNDSVKEDKVTTASNNSDTKKRQWITANDIDYLILVMIYSLLRSAWEKSVLVIGLVKDIAAADMIKSVLPILELSGSISFGRELPRFNSDKMLLQTASIINSDHMVTPWRTFEYDTCFKTMVPLKPDEISDVLETKDQKEKGKEQEKSIVLPTLLDWQDRNVKENNQENTDCGDDSHSAHGQTRVAGAFKNLISGERMFLKSYIQLWSSMTDPTVKSHVFCYDRPCYPEFDSPGEISLYHKDGDVVEEIKPIIHFNNDSDISHLVMSILCSMSLEVIPECIGHNYPLFLADKKAKSVLDGTKSAYLSTVSFEIAKSQFDQQVLFESKFRDYRSEIESSRRRK